jgi:cytochrome c
MAQLIFATAFMAMSSAQAASPIRFEGHGGPIRSIFISEDGRTAMTASFDYSLISWTIDSDGPRQRFRFTEHDAAVNDVAIVPAGDKAVSASDDGTVAVWDLEQNRLLRRFEGHGAKVLGIAISYDGRLAASAGWDNTARIWNLETLEPGPVLEGHRGNVNAVVFSPDGSRLYTASYDGTIRVWDTVTGSSEGLVYRHGWSINVMRLLPGGTQILIGANNGAVGIVDIATGAIEILAEHEGPVLAVAVWPRHGLAAAGGSDGTIRVWNLDNWVLLHEMKDPYGPAWSLAISGDGTTIYRAGLDDFVAGWTISPRAPFEPVTSEFPRRFQLREDMGEGEREFARKCSICHSLLADDQNRAGPTLYALFGRQAGSLPDYPYSPGLENSRIIWNEDTIARLFDEGPDVVTPGSKMPLQRLKDLEHRDALIAYLKIATAPENSVINESTPSPVSESGAQQQE